MVESYYGERAVMYGSFSCFVVLGTSTLLHFPVESKNYVG